MIVRVEACVYGCVGCDSVWRLDSCTVFAQWP